MSGTITGTPITIADLANRLGSASKVANLSDLTDPAAARRNIGLGTASTQMANSVTITGGNVDGAAIGSTTPAPGAFTTLAVAGRLNISNLPVSTDGTVPPGLVTGDIYVNGGVLCVV